MKKNVIICALFLIAYIIGEVHNEYNKNFRCKSGKYIRNEWFCDGDKDCENREDENVSGCKRYGCGRSKFSCDNSTSCKNITVRCNTIKDCEDGTDELNCGDEVNVKNCTSKDKFLCHDGLRCLDLQYTCDNNCHCFDCSDENDNCTKTDNDLLRRCPNAYFVTANGPQCLCDADGDQSDPLCKNIDSCTGRTSSCEQRCIKFKQATQCSCFPGYHPVNGTNGASCQSDAWYGNAILYATVLKIKLLNVSTNEATVVQSGVHNCSALTAANNYVYYATVLPGNKAGIFKSSIYSGTPVKIVETDFPVTSVAVDYITENIYFTSNGSLSVCIKNGSICIKLKCCDISYVTLAPKSGSMFYLQSHSLYSAGSALLLKSNMDGSNETIFADDVYRGNISIIADESESKLYLLEISNDYYRTKIDQVTFDAGTKDTTNARYTRCLGVLNGDIFITLDQRNDIYHTKNFRRIRNINEDTDAYFRDNSTSSTKQLYAYNSLLQRSNQNPCSRSRCYGICLTKPSRYSSFLLTSSCVCDNTRPSSENLRCSNYPVQSASSSSSSGIVVFILVLVILAVLGAAGYYFVPPRSWYQYYSTLRTWQQSKRSQRLYTNNPE